MVSDADRKNPNPRSTDNAGNEVNLVSSIIRSPSSWGLLSASETDDRFYLFSAERLKNLHIEVGLSVEQRYEIHNHPGVVPAVLDIALSATHTARYVKIWQQAYGYLTICGLQVFGKGLLLQPERTML